MHNKTIRNVSLIVQQSQTLLENLKRQWTIGIFWTILLDMMLTNGNGNAYKVFDQNHLSTVEVEWECSNLKEYQTNVYPLTLMLTSTLIPIGIVSLAMCDHWMSQKCSKLVRDVYQNGQAKNEKRITKDHNIIDVCKLTALDQLTQ